MFGSAREYAIDREIGSGMNSHEFREAAHKAIDQSGFLHACWHHGRIADVGALMCSH